MLTHIRLALALLAASIIGCGPDTGPAVALINQEIECQNALAEGLVKVKDEASADAALPSLKPIADRFRVARTALVELSKREAWVNTAVQSQGPRLMAAASRLQQETLRVAQMPGTSRLLSGIAAATTSTGR